MKTFGTPPGKPPIDTGAFTNWAKATSAGISNNGRYAYYETKNNWDKPSTIFVRQIDGNWQTNFFDFDQPVFTEDSHELIGMKSKDSLCLVNLGTSAVDFLAGVKSFRLFTRRSVQFLACQLNTPDNELILLNLKTRQKNTFKNVQEFLLNPDGTLLVLKTQHQTDSAAAQSIIEVDLVTGRSNTVWTGGDADNLTLSDDARQLAFRTTKTAKDQSWISIWLSVDGGPATLLTADESLNPATSLTLLDIQRFSKNGSYLFIHLKPKALKANPVAVKVDLWSYTDAKLQSDQLTEFGWGPKPLLADIEIRTRQINQIEQENDRNELGGAPLDSLFCLFNNEGQLSDYYWSSKSHNQTFLVGLNGQRKELNIKFSQVYATPGGRYVIGSDESFKNIYSYDLVREKIRNLTQSLPVPLTPLISRYANSEPYFEQFRGFIFAANLQNGDVLIYDEYDIWQIDPAGNRPPVNLTRGYGRKNDIIFRLAQDFQNKSINTKSKLLLSAFDLKSKQNGFYAVAIENPANLELLNKGNYLYYFPDGYLDDIAGLPPVTKARDAEVYLVQRQSCSESPNFFWTKNFKAFYPLSDIHPEKSYNWMSSELFTFKTLDGRTEQGIIYKPENFNPANKYPVIFNYYETRSQNLNKYQKPFDENGGQLDIAWFTSHGYVVAVPDIHLKTGEIGQSALNSILGAAKAISDFPWVNSERLGLEGHSFAGYETNYVITKTNAFAAAVSSSGLSDYISEYGTTLRGGNENYVEVRQTRMGGTLWERPDVYINNSPLFQADKISTPILTVSNEFDRNVSPAQGMEWFLALRRLGKKAWMLRYDGQGHGVGGIAYNDFIIRSTQFFDFYLKNSPAPSWMIKGIPAKMKQIDNGLELEPEGVVPGPGLPNKDTN